MPQQPGDSWESDPLRRLSPEEAKQVKPINDQRIQEALEKGKRNAEAFLKGLRELEDLRFLDSISSDLKVLETYKQLRDESEKFIIGLKKAEKPDSDVLSICIDV